MKRRNTREEQWGPKRRNTAGKQTTASVQNTVYRGIWAPSQTLIFLLKISIVTPCKLVPAEKDALAHQTSLRAPEPALLSQILVHVSQTARGDMCESPFLLPISSSKVNPSLLV